MPDTYAAGHPYDSPTQVLDLAQVQEPLCVDVSVPLAIHIAHIIET
jgi:hypothetical protein